MKEYQPEEFLFEIISDGVIQDKKNKNAFTVVSEKKKHKFILMKNEITKNLSFNFTVKIRKISGFMAFGLCDKLIVSQNQYKFNGISNHPHGCFLVSSNKFIWNHNLILQNNLFVQEMPFFKKDDEIEFTYDPILNELKFKINNEYEATIKRIITEKQRCLVPCFIMINKNDEISINS